MTKRWEISSKMWARNSLQHFQRQHQKDVTFRRCPEDGHISDVVAEDAVAEPAEDIKAEEDKVTGVVVLIRLAQIASSSPSIMEIILSTTLLLTFQAPSSARWNSTKLTYWGKSANNTSTGEPKLVPSVLYRTSNRRTKNWDLRQEVDYQKTYR